MNATIKKFLFPTLAVCSALALTRRLFARATVTPALTKPDTTDGSYDAVDAYIEEQMRRLSIPGVSLAIVEGDRITHLRGFGHARPGGEAPNPQTPFFIGSITKSFTALAVMQLVEAGKVELDAPVQRYLPWFRVADLEASAQMTVRHLLNQTSGLPYFPPAAAMADFYGDKADTERQVRALANLKTNPAGARFAYSNLNYDILGLIVEAASGEPYAEYIHQHIFDSLEMRHSYTTKAAAQQNGLAAGHRHWFSRPFPSSDMRIPVGSLPSGWLISSAEDMAHYLIAHLNGGRYGEAQVLSQAGIDELHRGVAEQIVFGSSVGFYGMGWFEINLDKTKTFSHGGNVPDFSAFMALIPEQKKGVVILLNADPYGLPIITEEFGMGATALLAGQQPAPARLDFVQWIARCLPLIPLLQLAGVIATFRILRHWQRDPVHRPSRGRMWRQQVLLPLIPNLSLAAILAYLQSSGLIRFLQLFMPDLAWTAQISGGFAGVWAFLRTGMVLQVIRHRDE